MGRLSGMEILALVIAFGAIFLLIIVVFLLYYIFIGYTSGSVGVSKDDKGGFPLVKESNVESMELSDLLEVVIEEISNYPDKIELKVRLSVNGVENICHLNVEYPSEILDLISPGPESCDSDLCFFNKDINFNKKHDFVFLKIVDEKTGIGKIKLVFRGGEHCNDEIEGDEVDISEFI